MTKRILIVDDEADIRDIIQAALEDVGGWQTLGARSGAEALGLAQPGAIDAILLDISMPDMDGFELFEQLQTRPEIAQVPIIVLTSKVLARDCDRLATLALAGLITKPFNPLTLAQQIADYLGW